MLRIPPNVARRPSNPALYEVIKAREAPKPDRPLPEAPPTPPPAAPSSTQDSILAPGTAIRLPVGYVGLAFAVMIVVAAGFYMFGYSRGERATQSRLEDQAGDLIDRRFTGTDPLLQGPEASPKGNAGDKDGARSPVTNKDRTNQQPPADRAQQDPRQPGLNYLLIDSKSSSPEMRELIAFCIQNGLDARIVRDNNAGPPKVIVLPGFKAGELASKAAEDLKARTISVGKKWAESGPGRPDLKTAYFEKYLP